MKHTVEFTASTYTVNGQTFPADYNVTPSGAVVAIVTVQEDGQQKRLNICIDPDHELHPVALAAAQAARDEVPTLLSTIQRDMQIALTPVDVPAEQEPEQPAEQAQPEQEQQPEPEAEPEQAKPTQEPEQEPEQPAEQAQPEQSAEQAQPEQEQERDPKQARGPVPEKFFIGLESLKGRGWHIEFSGPEVYNRTRVIFAQHPGKKALEAVKAAGFYWSPSMKSWNRKLSFKAYRAAQALALELSAICG